MDSVKPFLDWRRARVSDVHNHNVVNHHIHGGELEALAKRVDHLEEKLKAGATMADLQLVVQAVLKQGDDMKLLAGKVLSQEANVDWLERNTAHKDLFLKKEQVQ